MQTVHIYRRALIVLWIGVIAVGASAVSVVHAQGSALTMSVIPTLIKLNLNPGETWSGEIQVVNGNPYTLNVYAEPVLFEPSGEEGRPVFKGAPGMDSDGGRVPDATTLAGWITVPTGSLEVLREQTLTVPITIRVPSDASPGGHYAAILLGNRAPQQQQLEESGVSVSSSIASLVLLRVAGDVVEDGRIRDFATEKIIYDTPEAQLSLRFENQGNVHIQPKGDVTIYNMFGKKRGVIPVNQRGDYGNVMPGSIRKFTYTWKSDAGVWDIGRYRAEATLGYGEESKSFAQATTYFYVLPIIPILEILVGGAALLWFLGWALRAYVRRAILIESGHVVATAVHDERSAVTPPELSVSRKDDEQKINLSTLVTPIRVGMVDLRRATVSSAPSTPVQHTSNYAPVRDMTPWAFIYHYRYFFAFLLVVAVSWIVASALIADVLTYERPYEVQVVEEGGNMANPTTPLE